MTDLLMGEALTAALAGLPGVHRSAVGSLGLRARCPGFPEAVRLVGAVAEVAEELDHHPDVDLRWNTVTFTLSTHSDGGVTEKDLELARRILALLPEGAEKLPLPDRVEIALDAADPAAVRPFWKAGLGYTEQETPQKEIELHHPDGAGPVVWFQRMDPPRAGRNRFHLDVYVTAEEAPRRIDAALAAGGTLTSDAHAPHWWVLADAEGNELCICVD